MLLARFHALCLSLGFLSKDVVANEIAFVNVASDDTFDVHALDVPVAAAKGLDNFFTEDPMVSHDWAHVRSINRSVEAHLASMGQKNVADERMRRIEDKLRPLYAVLPKNEHDRLANGTALYALHRFFSEDHGWSIKGLEPAGGSWLATETVGADVKQVNKYIVPTYIQELLVRHSGGRGLDLRLLAVFVASLEHLVRAEMIHLLYSVYATLEKPTAGEKNEAEIHEILSAFVSVFAFGVNLEVSTRKDVLSATRYLDGHHSGWRELQAVVRKARANAESSSGNNVGSDFAGILRMTVEFGELYGRWQHRDCTRAKELLLAWAPEPTPSAASSPGRVPLASVVPTHADGYRSLFVDKVDYMRNLGVLDESEVNSTSAGTVYMIVPNYVTSQSMCLSTASFYTVCCANECEELMGQFERAAALSGPTAEVVTRLTAGFRTSRNSDGQLPAALIESIRRLAAEHDGTVPLFSRQFAQWLHLALPNECPSPHDFKSTNPRTADEWMADPGSGADTEDMMNEIADTLARYTAMGSIGGAVPIADSDPFSEDVEPDVERLKHAPTVRETRFASLRVLGLMIKVVAAFSVIALMIRGGLATYLSGLDVMGGEANKVGAWRDSLA